MFDVLNSEVEVELKGHTVTFAHPPADAHLGFLPLVAVITTGLVRPTSAVARALESAQKAEEEGDEAEATRQADRVSALMKEAEGAGFETALTPGHLRRVADYLATQWLAFDGQRNGEVKGEDLLGRLSAEDLCGLLVGLHRQLGLTSAEKKTSA